MYSSPCTLEQLMCVPTIPSIVGVLNSQFYKMVYVYITIVTQSYNIYITLNE